MVKSYLRHGATQAFGLVCSAGSNSIYDGKLAYVPALEDVLVWDVKKGQQLAMWHETKHRAEVTVIVQSPQKDAFAVGYADGSVRLWNASAGTVVTTFNGHTKAITALAFDEAGARLASGSQDTTVILWDIIGEVGLFRLRGHRDQVTSIRFLNVESIDVPSTSTARNVQPGFLLTSAKDTFLKLWDLSTRHCVQTVVAHRAEIWTLDLDPNGDTIFTGGAEGELKAWKIDREAIKDGLKENENGEVTKMIFPLSTLPLLSRHRVSQISFHATQPFLAVQSHDRSVEIFRIRTEEEIKKKQLRRKKRSKEKRDQGKTKGQDMDVEDKADTDNRAPDLVDRFTPYLVVRASGKIRSFDFATTESGSKGGVHLLMALSSNSLEVFNIPQPVKSKDTPQEATRVFSLDLPGHRTDVRTLSISSDDQLLASASNGTLKVWNLQTTACIRTIDCGYALCSSFLPGDRHIAVGTKSGEILVYDVAASALVETITAHTGAVWSMQVRPDEGGLVTGSADKDVKFWDFERKPGASGTLSVLHVRTLKMTDDVLSVRYSPNGKLLAVSLLDSTVKVFYQDTLKFFLSLYGHKLPVLSMDISLDSKLIVTCSADKNVKIWGLDFGDCHKSIFAHEESIMQVAFEREKGSHYFWTVGKDKLLKYWDGDKFENIQKLEGHHGEIWALALSNQGKFVITGSHDKSIRLWEKLDEPLFLEEEQERDLEVLYENNYVESMNQVDQRGVRQDGDATEGEATAVGKQTTETLLAGERIMEALDLADAERAQPADVPRNPVLAALNQGPEEYVLQVVEKVSSTALHDALLVLPFGKVLSLMVYLNEWTQRGWNIALVSRLLFFLLQTHYNQIVTNRAMRGALFPLRKHLRAALRRQQEVIGYNLAALQFIDRREESRRTAELYEEEGMDEEKVKEKIRESGKKRKRVKA
ncbi:WD40 repeat-like protein [Ramaria rubella]|nr:WD40 repeat-like protein [Ramaria rubella]